MSTPLPPRARLRVEPLEDRCVPATNLFAVGADAGAEPHVTVYDANTKQPVFDFLAFDAGFRGGVRVAVTDYNGDGEQDIIAGAGPGAGPHVRVFDGLTLRVLDNFYAYDPGFAGGVTVAGGTFNRFDGFGARGGVVTGAGPGAPGGHVKQFDAVRGEAASFLAFDPGFLGGVSVAAGNTTGRASDSILVAAGAGAPGGHVKVFGPTLVLGPPTPNGRTNFVTVPLTELRSFFAFDAGFLGGASVTLANADDSGSLDVVVAAGAGVPGGHVKAFGGPDGGTVLSFRPFPASYTGATRVAAADATSDNRRDLLLSPDASAPDVPQVRVFDVAARAFAVDLFPFGAAYRGGVFVGAARA